MKKKLILEIKDWPEDSKNVIISGIHLIYNTNQRPDIVEHKVFHADIVSWVSVEERLPEKRCDVFVYMPEEYKKLDIAEHILSLCTTQEELQRCGHELLMFQERELFDLLRFLKYLVDTMRANNLVWGVGRGSSVASYVLYKLGVHRINSMFYDLHVEEFLR